MLQQVLQRGGLFLLTSILDFNSVTSSSACLKVALESLHRFFKAFKIASKSNSLDVFEAYGEKFEEIVTVFECELSGLDFLERCQYHSDKHVYRKALRILTKYFQEEPETDPLILYLDKTLKEEASKKDPANENQNNPIQPQQLEFNR